MPKRYRVFLGAPIPKDISSSGLWHKISSAPAPLPSQSQPSGYLPSTLSAASRRISLLYQNIIFKDEERDEESHLDPEEENETRQEQTTLLTLGPTQNHDQADLTPSLKPDSISFIETQFAESYSYNDTYSTNSDASIARFPTFHFSLHTLVSISDLQPFSGTRKICVLLAVLEVEGLDGITIKKRLRKWESNQCVKDDTGRRGGIFGGGDVEGVDAVTKLRVIVRTQGPSHLHTSHPAASEVMYASSLRPLTSGAEMTSAICARAVWQWDYCSDFVLVCATRHRCNLRMALLRMLIVHKGANSLPHCFYKRVAPPLSMFGCLALFCFASLSRSCAENFIDIYPSSIRMPIPVAFPAKLCEAFISATSLPRASLNHAWNPFCRDFRRKFRKAKEKSLGMISFLVHEIGLTAALTADVVAVDLDADGSDAETMESAHVLCSRSKASNESAQRKNEPIFMDCHTTIDLILFTRTPTLSYIPRRICDPPPSLDKFNYDATPSEAKPDKRQDLVEIPLIRPLSPPPYHYRKRRNYFYTNFDEDDVAVIENSHADHTTTENFDEMAAKQTFIIWAPDYMDEDVLPRRQSLLQKHLEGIYALAAKGWFKSGGYTVTPETTTNAVAERKVTGSLLIVEDESVEAVKKTIEADCFWTEKIWDHEKLDIRPYFSA
ncbi:hypothetical protein EW146_g6430 [Bondarzewia mesenterica]|uniref:YCII-related domain-containing protein n=1 Tax=Bondarzewia mesenterica TaxID=1095465 RepID=A0A4S4LNQ4_9AGAM|nr:hypothetical protein EW146_g6430 [Bondarzewia mesenterica]